MEMKSPKAFHQGVILATRFSQGEIFSEDSAGVLRQGVLIPNNTKIFYLLREKCFSNLIFSHEHKFSQQNFHVISTFFENASNILKR